MMEPNDLNRWLVAHAMSLDIIEGQDKPMWLLDLRAAPPVLAGVPPTDLQASTQSVPIVLGQSAAAILLRLLLDAGVQPAPAEGARTGSATGH